VTRFFPPAVSLDSANSFIVIALNLEREKPLTILHFVVGLLIAVEAFGVRDITCDIVAHASAYEIEAVSSQNYRYRKIEIEK
jgi:hypothetical protein